LNANAIAAVLGEEFDAEADSVSLQPSPTGKFNETWFADSPDLERPLVVRIAPPEDRAQMIFYEHRMMRQEPAIHDRIRRETSCPVPEILAFHRNDSRLEERDFLIMERLPGDPIGGSTESTMRELGVALRNVHDRVRAAPDRYGYLGEHRPMPVQPTWQEAFHTMWQALHDDIENCGGYPAEELDGFRQLLDRELSRFDHFHEPASLLHMDVWAENILTDSSGHLTGLIDWDRACWGDPEIEFAVLDYCGISTPGFWEGYGSDPRGTDPDAAIRRSFYLLYEVQKYIVIRIARNGNPDGAERFRQMARSLAAQLA